MIDVPYPNVFLETTYTSKSLDNFKRGHFRENLEDFRGL